MIFASSVLSLILSSTKFQVKRLTGPCLPGRSLPRFRCGQRRSGGRPNTNYPNSEPREFKMKVTSIALLMIVVMLPTPSQANDLALPQEVRTSLQENERSLTNLTIDGIRSRRMPSQRCALSNPRRSSPSQSSSSCGFRGLKFMSRCATQGPGYSLTTTSMNTATMGQSITPVRSTRRARINRRSS